MMLSLKCELAGLKLKNPTILASGIMGLSTGTLKTAVEGGAGAVILKSCGLTAREGNKNPTVVELDNMLLNSMGLPNPGLDELGADIKDSKALGVPVIASVFGENPAEFSEAAQKAESFGADAVELNISCPNISDGEVLADSIGKNPDLSAEVTKTVKGKAKIPIIVKLTPNVSDITEIAKACEKAGADALSAINTLGPGMVIDVDARAPVLAGVFGGVSGPAVKPIAVACVYKIYEAVKIPVIGMGGIISCQDALEFILAGASAVAVGTGIMYRGTDIFKKITDEMTEYMKENKTESIGELVGAAHG